MLFFNKKALNKYWAGLVFIIMAFSIIYFMYGKEHYLLSVVLGILLAFNTAECISFLIGSDGIKIKEYGKKYIILILIVIISFSSLLWNEFYFHDDYLNFPGHYQNFLGFSISQGRELTGLLTDLFSFVTIQNSYLLRIVVVFSLVMYVLILYNIVKPLINSEIQCICLSIIFVLIVPVINIACYGSMFCYILAFNFAAMSVIHFLQYYQDKSRISHILFCFINIITANLIYQATATVAFFILLLIIINKTEIKNSFCLYFFYTVIFGTATMAYLILVKVISKVSGITMMARGEIITFSDIGDKIIWFFTVVLRENINQICGSFLSNIPFRDKWMHYNLYFKSEILAVILSLIVVICILVFVIQLICNKEYLNLLAVTISIPLSYYCFLILKESSYTSYYSAGLCSILLLMTIKGIDIIIQHIKFIKFKNIIISLTICMLISSNYYIRDFWINGNGFVYKYLKENLKYATEADRVHIYGSLFPGTADIYVLNAAKLAFQELGLENKYIPEITSSTTKDYIETISYETWELMEKQLNQDEINQLKNMYDQNDAFHLYTIKYENISTETISDIKSLLVKSNLLPDESTAYLVDLQKIWDR